MFYFYMRVPTSCDLPTAFLYLLAGGSATGAGREEDLDLF
jgi:hypothetical protein